MGEAYLVLIGTVIGAVAGLLPKLLDMASGTSSAKQQKNAELRMLLAGVLITLVESTNDFLDKAAKLRMDQGSSASSGETADQRSGATDAALENPSTDTGGTADPLTVTMDAAFKMKSAWMQALVSFGDPDDDKKPRRRRRSSAPPLLDDRRQTIQDMLTELNKTYYASYPTAPRARIIEQLNKVEPISRGALNRLLRIPADP